MCVKRISRELRVYDRAINGWMMDEIRFIC